MASPPFGAIGSLTNVNGTTSVTRPAVSAGDLMLLGAVAAYGDATITPPSGWTALASIDQSSAFEFELRLYWKIAGGSEPSTYNVGIGGQGGGNNFGYGWIWTYTGADGTTPVPASATQRNTSSSTSATCPSVTTTAADQTLVCVYVSGSNSVANSWTPPSGMTERMDAGSNPSGFVVGIADLAVASAGATGTKTATQTSSATSNCISFAIASTGGPVTLAPADGTHAHAADSVTLSASGATNLVIADAAHAHAGDSIVLAAGYSLTIPVVNNTNTSQASVTIPKVSVQKLSDMLQPFAPLTNQTVNGSGNLVIANGALTFGTSYIVVGSAADGSKLFVYLAVAA